MERSMYLGDDRKLKGCNKILRTTIYVRREVFFLQV
jgi:hypothetical protein